MKPTDKAILGMVSKSSGASPSPDLVMGQGAIICHFPGGAGCSTVMNDTPPEKENFGWFMLNRSAIIVKPRQPFLDWLHTADPTSHTLTSGELAPEPTIYLIPVCDTEEDVHEVLRELCEEIFVEQLAGWFRDEEAWLQERSFDMFLPSV